MSDSPQKIEKLPPSSIKGSEIERGMASFGLDGETGGKK
jgi:hypothetical protein